MLPNISTFDLLTFYAPGRIMSIKQPVGAITPFLAIVSLQQLISDSTPRLKNATRDLKIYSPGVKAIGDVILRKIW